MGEPPRLTLQDGLDTQLVQTHERTVTAARRQALRRSGLVWLGAMVASGAAGYGLGLGFSAVAGWLNAIGVVKDPGLAKTLQKVFDPTLFAAVGLFTTQVASFFNEDVTGRLRPVTTRWIMRRTPGQVKVDPKLQGELVHSWQIEQTVDARVIGGRWTATELCTSLKLTFRQVATELRAGRDATGTVSQAAIDAAAAFLGGDLLASETLWFWIVPESNAVFALLRKPLAPYLRGVSDADVERLALATLAYVRANRLEIADAKRPGLEEAVERYFAPMVAQLLKRHES